jgi:hypothetical protein
MTKVTLNAAKGTYIARGPPGDKSDGTRLNVASILILVLITSKV